MAQVTYRGVKYNTEDNRQVSDLDSADLIYRGVSYTKEFNHLARLQRQQEKKNRLSAARTAFTQNMKANEVV